MPHLPDALYHSPGEWDRRRVHCSAGRTAGAPCCAETRWRCSSCAWAEARAGAGCIEASSRSNAQAACDSARQPAAKTSTARARCPETGILNWACRHARIETASAGRSRSGSKGSRAARRQVPAGRVARSRAGSERNCPAACPCSKAGGSADAYRETSRVR